MESKRCSTCGQDKPLSEFWWRSDQGQYSAQCKECRAKRAHRRYVVIKNDHARAVKARYDTYGRFRRYGITKEIYEQAIIDQDGKCKLCGASEPGGKGVWHIDHAHPAGQPKGFPRKTSIPKGFNQNDDPTNFRGLLCHACNVSLGRYESLVAQVGEDRLMRYLHPDRYDVGVAKPSNSPGVWPPGPSRGEPLKIKWVV